MFYINIVNYIIYNLNAGMVWTMPPSALTVTSSPGTGTGARISSKSGIPGEIWIWVYWDGLEVAWYGLVWPGISTTWLNLLSFWGSYRSSYPLDMCDDVRILGMDRPLQFEPRPHKFVYLSIRPSFRRSHLILFHVNVSYLIISYPSYLSDDIQS
jgi:hypothetical protein